MADFFEIYKDQIIRDEFCPPHVMGGTRLAILNEGKMYLVASRFQNIGRRSRLNDAVALFERALRGDAGWRMRVK